MSPMEVCEIRYAPTQDDTTDAQMVELISGMVNGIGFTTLVPLHGCKDSLSLMHHNDPMHGSENSTYHLVICYIAMENGPFIDGLPRFTY